MVMNPSWLTSAPWNADPVNVVRPTAARAVSRASSMVTFPSPLTSPRIVAVTLALTVRGEYATVVPTSSPIMSREAAPTEMVAVVPTAPVPLKVRLAIV